MQVIFLDFDGVLNSEASVLLSIRQRILNGTDDSPVNEDLCPVCTSTFQMILDYLPEAKIVISSSWRLFFNIEQLKAILTRYGIEGERVVGVTPAAHLDQSNRGDDISLYLEEHPEVTEYGILDDNGGMTVHTDRFVQTDYSTGLTLEKALEFIKLMDPQFDVKKNIFKRYYKEHSVVRQRAVEAFTDDEGLAGEVKS